MGLAAYLGLKLGGYLLWSHVGVTWLSSGARGVVWPSLFLGITRLVLGWVVGLLVAPFVVVAGAMGQLPLFYFTGLAAVRWCEWGVIHSLIPGAGGASPTFFTGGSSRGRLWRGLGVLVSYLADAPFLLREGFPHGRFLC